MGLDLLIRERLPDARASSSGLRRALLSGFFRGRPRRRPLFCASSIALLRGLELFCRAVYIVAKALKLVVERRSVPGFGRGRTGPGSNFLLLPKLRWNQTASSRAMRSW